MEGNLMKSFRILMVLMWVVILATGCSQEPEMTAPETPTIVNYDKNGSETLGPPEIEGVPVEIATGTTFNQGGIGMVDPSTGDLVIEIDAGVTIEQVFLYWAPGQWRDLYLLGLPGGNHRP
jgi:hypothetical protein